MGYRNKMKTFIVLLCLVLAGYAYDETLDKILKPPRNTMQLYRKFKSKQHMKFGSSEDKLRFRNFRKSARFVAKANERSTTVKFAMNMFSTMTKAEARLYTGLNVTGHFANPPRLSSGLQAVADEVLWTTKGAVTEVQNQGSCGSCWTYGAVAGLETRYKHFSGVLRKFSEQEYLDCVYEGSRNGCNGGWPNDGYDYSKNKRSGQLSSAAAYPYTGTDGACKTDKPNAAVAYKIAGYHSVGGTEAENIAALNTGSLSVAFEVTDYLQQYSSGIMKDTTCTGSPNHAVAAVGYTSTYVLVKNSWGKDWGDKGFVKFARNHGNCGLFQYSSYPSLESTGTKDSSASDPSSETPSDDESSSGGSSGSSCTDKAIDCDAWMCDWASLKSVMKDYCQKTCKYCNDTNNGACASGTVRCSDGVCRHEHMCKHFSPGTRCYHPIRGSGVDSSFQLNFDVKYFKLHKFHG